MKRRIAQKIMIFRLT